MPPAARITDLHLCPAPVPSGPIMPPGAPNVLIGFLPAARMGDPCTCTTGPAEFILTGAMDVLINGQPAARMGDPTAHGGIIAIGCPTVMIGMTPQASALSSAAASGAPFCEECDQAAKTALTAGKGGP